MSECQLSHVSPVQTVLESGSSALEGVVPANPLMVASQGAGLLNASLCLRMRLMRFLARFPSLCGSGLSDLPAAGPELGETGRLGWLASLGLSLG